MAIMPSQILSDQDATELTQVTQIEAFLDRVLASCWDGFNSVRLDTDDRSYAEADTIALLRNPRVCRAIVRLYTNAGWQVEVKQRTMTQNHTARIGERYGLVISFNRNNTL